MSFDDLCETIYNFVPDCDHFYPDFLHDQETAHKATGGFWERMAVNGFWERIERMAAPPGALWAGRKRRIRERMAVNGF